MGTDGGFTGVLDRTFRGYGFGMFSGGAEWLGVAAEFVAEAPALACWGCGGGGLSARATTVVFCGGCCLA